MEHLYSEVINRLKKLVDGSKNDQKKKEGAKQFLENIINRLNFIDYHEEEEYICMKKRLILEMNKLAKTVFTYRQNIGANKEIMQRNIDNLAWTNKKNKINRDGRNYYVSQREIYYAELGRNIGSEQNGRRPVVILQNNRGNKSAYTTVVAPVTTHGSHGNGVISYDKKEKKYFIQREIDGVTKKKLLDFYEIPLYIEGQKGIFGFVNIMQIRAIDRKRIRKNCKSVVTEDCFNRIIKAIEKNLEMSVDNFENK